MMKKITHYIFAVCIFSAIGGCSDDGNNLLAPCDPSLGETKFFSNETGVLTFTDSIDRAPLPYHKYFIFSKSITYVPLQPCNLPETEYNLDKGEQIDILFSGNVDDYAFDDYAFSDARSIQIELTMIQKLNPKD